jgi:hypothetical protein
VQQTRNDGSAEARVGHIDRAQIACSMLRCRRTDARKIIVAVFTARRLYTSMNELENTRISCRAGWGDGEPRVAKCRRGQRRSFGDVILTESHPNRLGMGRDTFPCPSVFRQGSILAVGEDSDCDIDVGEDRLAR